MNVLDQAKKLNGLLDKALSLTADGDRVAYAVKGFTTFRAGEYTAAEAVLNVPKDADFFGYSFNVFLQGRLVSLTNPSLTDRTFRPATLTWENTQTAAQDGAITFEGNADFKLEIRDSVSGPYQNAPFYSTSVFSTMADLPAVRKPLISAWQGSLQFSTPFYVPRGETVTVRLTPIDSRPDDPTLEDYEEVRREYRLMCVLQGYKSAHAFK
jgi:hypothetical protein